MLLCNVFAKGRTIRNNWRGGEKYSVHETFFKPTCLQDFFFLKHKLCTNFFPPIKGQLTYYKTKEYLPIWNMVYIYCYFVGRYNFGNKK